MIRLAGKPISDKILEELKQEVTHLKEKQIQTCLAVILVGDDPGSAVYVRNKKRTCEQLGILSKEYILPENAKQEELMSIVHQLNNDPAVHGILCQLPLPSHMDESEVIQAIQPEKDVDCFHPTNFGLLAAGTPRFMPCTPYGILQMLRSEKITTRGKEVVVIGRSNIVGRPLSILLSLKGYDSTVTICHSATQDLPEVSRRADILIAAIGRPRFVTADFVKPGAVVIDVGMNRIEDETAPKGTRLVGDVDYEGIGEKASAMTPVPGGVGLMTIAMLMYNTINAARLQSSLPNYEIQFS